MKRLSLAAFLAAFLWTLWYLDRALRRGGTTPVWVEPYDGEAIGV